MFRFTDGSLDFQRWSEFPSRHYLWKKNCRRRWLCRWTLGPNMYKFHRAPTAEEVVLQSFLLLRATCSRSPICWRKGCQHLHYLWGCLLVAESGDNFSFKTLAVCPCPNIVRANVSLIQLLLLLNFITSFIITCSCFRVRPGSLMGTKHLPHWCPNFCWCQWHVIAFGVFRRINRMEWLIELFSSKWCTLRLWFKTCQLLRAPTGPNPEQLDVPDLPSREAIWKQRPGGYYFILHTIQQ